MIKSSIIQKASELGFSLCGFARCTPLEELRPFYDTFVTEKRFASMQYLERYAAQRLDPGRLLPGAQTVISLALNYYPPEQIPTEDNFIISRYAYGQDYHVLIRERMEQLVSHMRMLAGDLHARAFVESGPVLEKAWAQRCGIGWQGKNTLLINRSAGSFLFLGIILTDLEMEPDLSETDHCGDCDKCIHACPAGALDTAYQLDIPRCIAYRTIENKTGASDDLPSNTAGRIYGCDLCQDACPWNRFAAAHKTPAFLPSARLSEMRKSDWTALTETEFNVLFEGSPVKRLGYARFMQNIRNNAD